MVDVTDEDGVYVNVANYADYGHISSGAPDADGTYTAIYTTGTKGGSVSFDAIDDSVYVKESSATASSSSALGAQSVAASATTSSTRSRKKKKYSAAKPKGFSRPGNLVLIGSTLESPAWLGRSVTINQGGPASSQGTSLKVLGIKYSSVSDIGNGKLSNWQFKYNILAFVVTHIQQELFDSAPKAAGAVYVAKNGTQMFVTTGGCAGSATSWSIAVGPVSAPVALPQSDDNNIQMGPLTYRESSAPGTPHIPNEAVQEDISITGAVSVQVDAGRYSSASASASILPWTLKPTEGQYTTQQAFAFTPVR